MLLTRDQIGVKWMAGILLVMMIVGMGQGFAVSVNAEEGAPAESAPASDPAPEPTPEPEPEPETTSEVEVTPEPETTPAPEPEATPEPEVQGASTEQSTEPQLNSETENNTTEVPGDAGEEGTPGEPIDETPPAENGENGAPNEDGGSGEPGDNATTTPVSDGEPAEINTGDASSSATAATGANTTSIDTNASSTDSGSPEENGGGGGGGDTTVEVGNGLSATTTAAALSETGENTGVDPDGVNIFTGEGVASVFDVLTFNIALVNSVGEIILLQNPLAEELDFRERILDVFEQLTGERGTCTLTVCQATDALFTYLGNNIGEVERNTYAGCNSGNNIGTSSDGLVLIDAGGCTGSNLTATIGNLTAVQSTYLIILMNHIGDLNADIILPEPSFFEALRGTGSLGANAQLASDNTVDVTNNGTSTASSGGNTAVGEDFSGVMSGGADADAFVGNFANQINPPTCFIISVGGEWTGEVYQMPEGYDRETTPFADIICGRGSGVGEAAGNLTVSTTNYAKLLVNAIAEATTGGNTAIGQESVIRSGDAQSFLNVLNILNTTLISQDWLFGLFAISGDWDGDFSFGARPDASPAEQAAAQLTAGFAVGHGSYNKKTSGEQVTLTKTVSADTITTPSTVEYTIALKNNGSNNIYDALLEDVLTDPQGNVVSSQSWDLEMIKPKEEILVRYTVEFTGSLLGGEYINAARLTGKLSPSSKSPSMKPAFTSAYLNVESGEVLGVQDCPAYLSDYITPYGKNDPEQVRLLEVFLRDGRGESVAPDGVYDAASVEAIKRFQSEHKNDILTPWGIDYPTGFVYFTTRKKINELYCNGEKTFPLSPLQVKQMELYRNGDLQPNVPELPVGSESMPTPWSAIDFPHMAGYTTPAYTKGLFSNALGGYSLLTLLRDIFSQIAAGFVPAHANAATYGR